MMEDINTEAYQAALDKIREIKQKHEEEDLKKTENPE
jgi:hypothetical protein